MVSSVPHGISEYEIYSTLREGAPEAESEYAFKRVEVALIAVYVCRLYMFRGIYDWIG